MDSPLSPRDPDAFACLPDEAAGADAAVADDTNDSRVETLVPFTEADWFNAKLAALAGRYPHKEDDAA